MMNKLLYNVAVTLGNDSLSLICQHYYTFIAAVEHKNIGSKNQVWKNKNIFRETKKKKTTGGNSQEVPKQFQKIKKWRELAGSARKI